MENSCNFAHMVLIDFCMRFVDLDFNFVEHTFGANEEVTSGRIATPNNSGSAVHLNAESACCLKPVQSGQVARQDGVFGVFDVFVLHERSMAGPGALWGVWCAVCQLVAAADLGIK